MTDVNIFFMVILRDLVTQVTLKMSCVVSLVSRAR